MPTGLIPGISNEEYQSGPEVSASRLKVFHEAPAKAKFGAHKTTKAFLRGTVTHCAILEPNELDRRYAPTDLEREGTYAWQEEERRQCGRELIKRPLWDEVRRMRDSVLSHPTCKELLIGYGIDAEQSVYWQDERSGVRCRARPDGLVRGQPVVIDVKTTRRASASGFRSAISEYRYHWQEAHYRMGLEAVGWGKAAAFFFIAIETEVPFLCAVYEIVPDDIIKARARVRELYAAWAECERTGIWPGYNDRPEMLPVLEYANAI